ncbi:MAG: hypothetical protein Kow0099_15080 [Candidatus Abyssubacteria bacterium]
MKKRTFGLSLEAVEDIIPVGSVLDVGCATGFFLEAALERGWAAYGVEPNPYAYEQARREFGDRVFLGTIETGSINGLSFDVIFMFDVLEHVRDPLGTLVRAGALLRNGGLVAIATPDIASMSARLLGRRWPHLKSEHQFYFSSHSLSRLLARAGFRTLLVRRALKALSLNYIHAQRSATPVPVLTPVASALCRCLPDFIRRKPIYFHTGELFLVAEKS